MGGVMDMFDLTGRTALVTGASRGIGRAIAIGLAECGADVVVHFAGASAVGDEAAAGDVARDVRALGRRAFTADADFTDPAAPDRLHATVAAGFGPVDVLVLNASVQHRYRWDELPPEVARAEVQVNLLASLRLVQLFALAMVRRKWGRIVTVGSVQQDVPAATMPIYAATKSAQFNLVRNLARDLAPDGVTVNNISPGVIGTDRNAEVLDDPVRRETILGRIRMGFVGEPRDCVGAALLLCGDAGRYITGSDLRVDGGWSLQ